MDLPCVRASSPGPVLSCDRIQGEIQIEDDLVSDGGSSEKTHHGIAVLERFAFLPERRDSQGVALGVAKDKKAV